MYLRQMIRVQKEHTKQASIGAFLRRPEVIGGLAGTGIGALGGGTIGAYRDLRNPLADGGRRSWKYALGGGLGGGLLGAAGGHYYDLHNRLAGLTEDLEYTNAIKEGYKDALRTANPASLQNTITGLSQTVLERDNDIKTLRASITANENTMARLNRAMDGLRNQLNFKNHTQKRFIENMKRSILEKSKQVKELQDYIASIGS